MTCKMIKFRNYMLCAGVILLAYACAISTRYPFKNNEKTDPKILFLNYTMSKSKTRETKVALANKIIVKGKIKDNSIKIDDNRLGNLECIQADDKLNSIKTIYINNPINKTIEYVNDNGEFEKKQIKLDSAQFSIRMQLDSKTKFILIKQINQLDKQNVLLSKIKI